MVTNSVANHRKIRKKSSLAVEKEKEESVKSVRSKVNKGKIEEIVRIRKAGKRRVWLRGKRKKFKYKMSLTK